MAPKKCILCGEFILDNDMVPYKGRYAHGRCFNASVKAVSINKSDKIKQAKKDKKNNVKSEPKAKAELKDALSEEEYQYKKQFYDYLNNVLQVPSSVKIYTLIDKYKNQYNCGFEQMYQTLVYLNDIADIELKDDVVGLIPYYYDKAVSWFNKIKLLEEQNQNISIDTMYKEQTIQVSRQQKRKKNLIDISSI